MDQHLGLLLIVAAATAGAGFVQSAMGFGFALTAMAILPFWLDVRLANLVISFSALVPLAADAITHRRQLEWAAIRPSLVAMVLCVPLGLLVFVSLPTLWLVRGTGAAILLLSLHGLLERRSAPDPVPVVADGARRRWGGFAGAASGFLAGSTGIGGPPLVAYAVRQPWTPSQAKGYIIPLLLIQTLVKAGGLLGTDLLDARVILYSAIAFPFAYIGGFAGSAMSRRMDPQRFRQATYLLLALVAVGMMASR